MKRVLWPLVLLSMGVRYCSVSNAVHHRQAGLVSVLLQGIPTKVLTHGGDTTCATVVTLDKSDGSSMYHFKLV